MTSIINFITTWFETSHTYGSLYGGVAVFSVVLLVVLLVERVLLEAHEGRPVGDKAQVFTIVIWPLLFVMVVVMYFRVAQVLNLR